MANQRFSILPARAVEDSKLPDSAFRTLAALGIFGDKHGWAWPSWQTLADIRGLDRRSIRYHINQLTAAGYLNIHPRFNDEGSQMSNAIQIKFDHNYDAEISPQGETASFQGGGKQLVSPKRPNQRPNQRSLMMMFQSSSMIQRTRTAKAAKMLWISCWLWGWMKAPRRL